MAVVNRRLIVQGKKGRARVKGAVIEFSWKVSSSAVAQRNITERAVEQANTALFDLLQAPDAGQQSVPAIGGVLSVVDNVKSTAEIWEPLLKNVNAIVEIVDKMTEVRRVFRPIRPSCSLCPLRFIHMHARLGPFYRLFQRSAIN